MTMLFSFLAIISILEDLVVISANVETKIMKPYMLPIPPNNHGIQSTVLINQEIKIFKNNNLAIIPTLSTEWSVSFNVRIVKIPSSGFQNLIRFTNDPNTDGIGYGLRTPFVNFNCGGKFFHIASAVNGNYNYWFNHKSVSLNQTYHLEINQRYISNGEYRYYIIVDGVEVHFKVNTDARQFYNVHVYASDPHQPAADAYISNLKYVNFL